MYTGHLVCTVSCLEFDTSVYLLHVLLALAWFVYAHFYLQNLSYERARSKTIRQDVDYLHLIFLTPGPAVSVTVPFALLY